MSFGRDTRASGSLPPGLMALGRHSLLGLQSSGLDGRPSEADPGRYAVLWTSGLGATDYSRSRLGRLPGAA